MTNFKKLTIRVIIFHFFILVGFGHGLACIGLLEIAGIFSGYRIGDEPLRLSLTGAYESSLGAAALFAFAGEVLLILSLLQKKFIPAYRIRVTGLGLLFLSWYYLAHTFFDDETAQLAGWTGIPFLISGGMLLYWLIVRKRELSINEKQDR